MISYLYKPKRKIGGKHKPARLWRARLRMPWESKCADIALGTTDKQSAQQRLNELIAEREAEHSGRIPSKVVREALQKPLTDLLEDFLAELEQQNCSTHYVQVVGSHVRRVFVGCGWKHLSDVDAGAFLKFRASLRTRKGEVLSARSQNDWLDSLTVFFKWLVKPCKVIKENPLADISKIDARGEKRVKRRAASFPELEKLLQVAGEKRVVYHFAARTGLRRSEIKQVRLYDLHLDVPAPYLAVRGSTTKNGKDAHCDLSLELVAELKGIIPANAKADDFLFKRVPLVPELCKDLEKAGIPFLDELGRRLDFHALRKTFNTHLAACGVSTRERMAMMRHSDEKLTNNDYLDVEKLGLREALAKLPKIEPALSASQTDSQIDSHISGFSMQGAALAGNQDVGSQHFETVATEEDGRELALCGSEMHENEIGGGCRNRTDS